MNVQSIPKMKSLRQFLVCAIVISAFVAVYSLEDASDPKGNVQIADASASDMARRRRHRFGHHLCKNFLYHFKYCRLGLWPCNRISLILINVSGSFETISGSIPPFVAQTLVTTCK